MFIYLSLANVSTFMLRYIANLGTVKSSVKSLALYSLHGYFNDNCIQPWCQTSVSPLTQAWKDRLKRWAYTCLYIKTTAMSPRPCGLHKYNFGI